MARDIYMFSWASHSLDPNLQRDIVDGVLGRYGNKRAVYELSSHMITNGEIRGHLHELTRKKISDDFIGNMERMVEKGDMGAIRGGLDFVFTSRHGRETAVKKLSRLMTPKFVKRNRRFGLMVMEELLARASADGCMQFLRDSLIADMKSRREEYPPEVSALVLGRYIELMERRK